MTKYLELCRVLKKEFQDSRLKYHRLNFGWLWSKARKTRKGLANDPNITVSKHVKTNFIKKNDVRMRTRQGNWEISKELFCSDLMKLNSATTELLELAKTTIMTKVG